MVKTLPTIVATVCLFAAQVIAEPGPSSTALPETPPGRIAAKLFQAVNGGESNAPVRFATECIIEEPWQMMTREKYEAMIAKLREQSGDLRVERVMMSDERNLRVMIGSAKAGKKVGLEIVLPPHETNRAALVWVHYFPGKHPAPLPQGALDEAAQIAALDRYLENGAQIALHSGSVLVAQGDRILLH